MILLKEKNFQRGHIFERFMSRVEPTYNISSQRDENIDICPECGVEKVINYNEGIASCEKCGACDFIKIDCDKKEATKTLLLKCLILRIKELIILESG